MGEETLIVVIFGGLHLLGIGFAMLLLLPLLRDERVVSTWAPPEEDDSGGGGNDRVTPEPPRDPTPGGLPLPDAVPARVRLRGTVRLGDLTPPPARRREHVPAPERTPEQVP
ncbi:hypothetical protein [Conexibacter arvalis]|uniref:Uncharacterized protein n=1 Tax=Conexibacter arvalis TaxID=912552 RepID=A0A840IBX0_9ACTN|nr:hypothetical protein [Conexibacter arvalis]MBB4661741.1 hypothetical protein [Conexibacter arvalis]